MGCDLFKKPAEVIVDRPVEVSVYVPEYLRHCSDVPKPNVVDSTDQRAAADYVTVLHQVASECHDKLGTVDGILNKQEAASAARKGE